jgi:hypothetical protein
MYLHAGNHKNIKIADIVGIFDTDTATVSQITKRYLSECEKKGETVSLRYELPKAFILTSDHHKKNTVYFSQLSTPTLRARIDEPLK